MSLIATYAIAAAGAVLVLLAGSLAAWRLIPRPEAPPDLQAVWAEVQANRLAILDLADKYETTVQRGRARGRKDKPESDPAPATKDELRRANVALFHKARSQ